MAARVVGWREKDAFVAGLDWKNLVNSKGRGAEIRGYAAEVEATKVLVVGNATSAMVGLYTAMEDEMVASEDGPVAANFSTKYSLAGIFAGLVGDSNSVLAYTLPDGVFAAVIVVQGGMPVVDQIKSVEEAREAATRYVSGNESGFSCHLWTNDLNGFPSGQLIEDQALWAAASKAAALVNKPANVAALISLLVGIAVLAGGGYAYQQYSAKKKREELLAAAAAADPTPKYQEALALEINRMGWTGDQVLEALKLVGQQPTSVAGWNLKSVVCTAVSSGCVSTWARKWGTTDVLVDQRRLAGEEMAGDSTQDVVTLTFKLPLTLGGLGSTDKVPARVEWLRQTTPLFQLWSNAGMSIDVRMDSLKKWPEVPGVDLAGVDDSVAIRSMDAEFKGSLPMVSGILSSAPSNFIWKEITVTPDISQSDLATVLSLNVKGGVYVR